MEIVQKSWKSKKVVPSCLLVDCLRRRRSNFLHQAMSIFKANKPVVIDFEVLSSPLKRYKKATKQNNSKKHLKIELTKKMKSIFEKMKQKDKEISISSSYFKQQIEKNLSKAKFYREKSPISIKMFNPGLGRKKKKSCKKSRGFSINCSRLDLTPMCYSDLKMMSPIKKVFKRRKRSVKTRKQIRKYRYSKYIDDKEGKKDQATGIDELWQYNCEKEEDNINSSSGSSETLELQAKYGIMEIKEGIKKVKSKSRSNLRNEIISKNYSSFLKLKNRVGNDPKKIIKKPKQLQQNKQKTKKIVNNRMPLQMVNASIAFDIPLNYKQENIRSSASLNRNHQLGRDYSCSNALSPFKRLYALNYKL
ncbi:unnamed protein product [Moneuplotes crassus]|uniref:Uncharacterized protein n=1 Tax=Euplotes crassus TaxID=5936 RepID=A0AAD1UIT5_EUPCR|nr:unnamed protein product [Moneuplotes crassus]